VNTTITNSVIIMTSLSVGTILRKMVSKVDLFLYGVPICSLVVVLVNGNQGKSSLYHTINNCIGHILPQIKETQYRVLVMQLKKMHVI